MSEVHIFRDSAFYRNLDTIRLRLASGKGLAEIRAELGLEKDDEAWNHHVQVLGLNGPDMREFLAVTLTQLDAELRVLTDLEQKARADQDWPQAKQCSDSRARIHKWRLDFLLNANALRLIKRRLDTEDDLAALARELILRLADEEQPPPEPPFVVIETTATPVEPQGNGNGHAWHGL